MTNRYINSAGVYDNKLGIRNAALLERVEYETSTIRQAEIISGKVELQARGFGLDRQKAIHHHLFEQIYGWAGQVRTIPLAKRMENGMYGVFASPDSIEEKWKSLEKQTEAFVQAKGLSFEQKREALVDIFVQANHIHAFPEGNGRCLQTFMTLLAREQGVDLDYGAVNTRRWNHASAVSALHGDREIRDGENFLVRHAPDAGPIRDIFAEMARPSPQSMRQKIMDAARGVQVRLAALSGKKADRLPHAPASAWGPEQERRAASLDGLQARATGPLLTFAQAGAEAIKAAGSAARVDWRQVEDAAMATSLQRDRQSAEDVFRSIAQASPAVVTQAQQAALRDRVDAAAQRVQASQRPPPDPGPSPQ